MKKPKLFFQKKLARGLYEILRPLQPVLHLKKRTFFDKFKVKTKDGVTFWLYNNAFYWETEMFWSGFENFDYERKSREVWCSLARESRIILDIGSNTGWFSMMAQAYNPNAEIHAFEPQPNVFQVLQKNVEINSFGVICNPFALSDEEGTFPFYNTGAQTFLTENTNHGSLNKEWRPEKQHSIQVEVKRLDEYWKGNPNKVDLIKIDVETFEYEVLKGYGSLLFEHRPIILLEIQDEVIGNRVASLFNDKGFYFFHIHEKEGLMQTSVMGLRSDEVNRNFLICPKEKQALIEKYIAK